jgi:hypothetical protein
MNFGSLSSNSESGERIFTEDQAFSSLYDLASAPVSFPDATHRKTEKERQLADGRRGGSGGGVKS